MNDSLPRALETPEHTDSSQAPAAAAAPPPPKLAKISKVSPTAGTELSRVEKPPPPPLPLVEPESTDELCVRTEVRARGAAAPPPLRGGSPLRSTRPRDARFSFPVATIFKHIGGLPSP